MWLELSHVPDGVIKITLPMPPDHRFTFSGSALPFPSEDVAFKPSQSPLHVHADVDSHRSKIVTLPPDTPEPNYYYRDGAYSRPRARAVYLSNGRPVDDMCVLRGVRRVPGRSLTAVSRYFPRSVRDGPVVTQESLLRSRAMPWTPCRRLQDV